MENSQKLLEKIQKQKISQKSRLQFTLKNIFFWTLFAFSIIIGGLSFSVILFAFNQTDFNLLSQIPNSKIELFLGLLPFFWIFSCLVFLLISIFGIRHTKTGYRYSPLLVFGSSIILSIVLGTALFFTGGAEKMERIFAENVSVYKSFEERKISRWSRPENGFLSGMILENKNSEIILIEDFSKRVWEINIQDAIVRPRASLDLEEKIKIIGKVLEENIFVAQEIRQWDGRDFKHGK
ncbi:MAG: hypothetical protein KAQ87_04855 [Candidatus Pacebacteria bacterium]|nr:hypothetical protein [Candidatus Paceibacterota bacterium]